MMDCTICLVLISSLISVFAKEQCILHASSFESQFCDLKSEVTAMGLKYSDLTQVQKDIANLKHDVQYQTERILNNEKAINSNKNITDQVQKLHDVVADLLNRTAEIEAKATGSRNYCSPNPCQNNASCIELSDGYYCACVKNYTGQRCEQEDHCTSLPCKNGGTCFSNALSYMCNCTSGYGGPDCSIKHNPCDSDPCVYGLCVQMNDTYSCNCNPGFSGINCDVSSSSSPIVTSPASSTSIRMTSSTTMATTTQSVCDIQPRCNPPADCVPIPGSNDFRCVCPETNKTLADPCLQPVYLEPFGFCCRHNTCNPSPNPDCS